MDGKVEGGRDRWSNGQDEVMDGWLDERVEAA